MSLKTSYIIWLILITMLYLLLCGFAHQWKHIIPLNEINISETKILYEDDIQKLTGLVAGIPLFSIRLDSVREHLLSNPYINDVIINKQFTGTVKIKIFERDIKASVSLNLLYYLDADARILPKIRIKTIPNVPVITGFNIGRENIKIGKILNDENIIMILHILDTTKIIDEDFYSIISELHITDKKDFVMYTNDYAIPIIIGRENYKEKITLLSSFWKQYIKPENYTNISYIDARFKDQLVVKWKETNNENIL